MVKMLRCNPSKRTFAANAKFPMGEFTPCGTKSPCENEV
ncbi:hypothetical protein Z949_3442 [Sulfitobacter guttiformis KCTC 32187]|nr:hypothetical protein Z949_3442 [Sulfitobacter guttiformis KCTC 32187]